MKRFFLILFSGMMAFTASESVARKNNPPTKVIAHRGAWKNTGAPQNSIAALKEAIRLKCDGSEFDVRMTADGHAVVNHDPTLQGVSIDKSTFGEVRDLKLANGEPIPTLEAYLRAGKGQKHTRLVLEIKTLEGGKEQTLELTRKCVALVKKLGMQKMVDYIAFDYDACKEVVALDPKANVAYLSGDKAPGEVVADRINGVDYNQKVYRAREGWIKEAHEHKQTVNVWTVNQEEDMKWFAARRVDFITTDEPELLQKVLK